MQIKHLEIRMEGNAKNQGMWIVKNKNTGKIVRLGDREVRYLLELLGEEEKNPELFSENMGFLTEEQQVFMKDKFLEWYFLDDFVPKEKNSLELSKIKLINFNVNKVIKFIYPTYSKLFTKAGFLFFLTCIAVNIGILIYAVSIVEPGDLEGISLKFSVVDIIVIAALLLLNTVLHELAHGVVCTKYGGTVQKMGVLLFYFVPCFYCDVTDIYLINERKKRAWVALAGVYVNLFSGFFLLMLTQILSFFNILPLSVIYFAAVSIGIALYNLIPFVKLDGYWLISAISGVTNLMDKSFLITYITFFRKEEMECLQASGKKQLFLILFFISSILFKPLFWGNNLIFLVGLLKVGGFLEFLIIAAGILIVGMDLFKTFMHYKKMISSGYKHSLGFI